jgi:predicted membrane-bound spermidine synthase
MARFDAVKNGMGVVICAIVVGIILGIAGAVLGTRFNVASQLHLTIDAATLTIAGVISLAIPLIVMMGVAACRGRAGQEAGGQRVEG